MPIRTRLSACICFLFLTFINNNLLGQQAKLILPVSHTNKLEDITVSLDEKYMASVDLDGVIKFWEVSTGKLYQTFSHTSAGTVVISSDNRYVISGSLDQSIKVWDVESGQLFKTLIKHPGALSCMKLSNDGKRLVSGDQQGNVVLWNMENFQPVYIAKTGGGMVNDIVFSNNGKWFAAAVWQDIYLWDLKNEKPIQTFKGHADKVHAINFSNNDQTIVSSSWDKTAKTWNTSTGKNIMTFTGHRESVFDVQFSPDQKQIVTAANDSTIRIWDVQTGSTIKILTGHKEWVTKLRFTADGNSLISISFDNTARIWKYPSGQLMHQLKGHKDDLYYIFVLKNTDKLLLGSYDNDVSRWDLATGKMDFIFGLHNETITSVSLSNSGEIALLTYRDGALKLIDLKKGSLLKNINAHTEWATSAVFTNDDSVIISAGTDNRIRMWQLSNSKLITEIQGDAGWTDANVEWSPDGNFLMSSGGKTFSVFNMSSGKRIIHSAGSSSFNIPEFSASGKYLVQVIGEEALIWDTELAKVIKNIGLRTTYPGRLFFTPDEKNIASIDSSIVFYDIVSGKQVKEFGPPDSRYIRAQWLQNNTVLAALDQRSRIHMIDRETGKTNRIIQLDTIFFKDNYHNTNASNFIFSDDEKTVASKHYDFYCLWNMDNGKFIGKYDGDIFHFVRGSDIFIVSNRGALDVYKKTTGKLMYKHFIAGEQDYLVMDSLGRYDGTEAARKQLYFTCGTEVIELEAVKDQLWKPGLAERISNADVISGKSLSELNLCGLTPVVENLPGSDAAYRFSITPRRGGLGESVLRVNGIEARRYRANELVKTNNGYELLVKKTDLESFFIAGKENPVTLKSYTADNAVSSRGLRINVDKTKETIAAPNLYAVMVGVSDYKGEELDLKYAAKDATDISSAISNAAKKLLNIDGKEHVFMYNLTTGKDRYQLPEKNSIKNVLEEIGKKATANDILLIFFAGHGVMEGEKKQFYFLTADASRATAISAIADVGISTTELTDWMKPQSIKAQKRILIFDACNSGQAIKDLVQIGSGGQDYLAARSDEKAQQIKAIDKLNEKSGLFILSASVSNQSAYEMGRYSQGLLTYSLLKAIKQQPDILEGGKYLDVGRWFSAAEKTVTAIAKESGSRQDPQIVTNTNFNIGVVDESVMSNINLPNEKPLFAASNFQNSDEAIADDDLELSKQVNLQLNDLSARSADAHIVYVTASNSPDAYSLSGRYTVTGNGITVSVNIKQNKTIKTKFELSGTKDKLEELAAAVAEKAAGMVK
ncbi:MAG: caspase family protein [Ferruginibacter sp.]